MVTDQWFPDVKGGSARVAVAVASGLADRGHEVVVLAPRHPGAPQHSSTANLELHRTLGTRLDPRSITDAVETWRYARHHLDRRFDVVLAHQISNAVGLLAARLPAPLALVFHASAQREARFDRASLQSSRARVKSVLLDPILGLMERLSLTQATRVFVLSDFSRALAIQRSAAAEGRIRKVGGGVDTKRFIPATNRSRLREGLGIAPGTVALFTVRRLEPRMGIDSLLASVPLLRAEKPVHLFIAGGGSMRNHLARLSDDYGLADRVTFLGTVTDNELLTWYQAADLFVLPTLAYEGFGMVTAEALACGTPVVGTAVGAIPEVLGPLDDRLLAEPTPDSLATAITSALRLPARDLRARSRDYAAATFSWSSVLANWEAALTEAANASL